MKRIRAAERCLANYRSSGDIGGPVHLSIGQEAVAVGVSTNLSKKDMVFGAHRSHAHLLALGSDLRRFFAEILGKDTGLSKGMGGSMHLWDQSVGFSGSVPIVAGTVSLAAGAALSFKLKNAKNVAVAYLGDGAMEEGVVHETLNFSAINKLPIIFVIENNRFASHMDITERQPSMFTARFAKANGISFEVVNGNNVLAMELVSQKAINHAKLGDGPFFIEAVTYRWLGHVDWREDIDVGITRSLDELESWKKHDPISNLVSALVQNNFLSLEDCGNIDLEIDEEIRSAWNTALNDPFPENKSLLERVYFNHGDRS